MFGDILYNDENSACSVRLDRRLAGCIHHDFGRNERGTGMKRNATIDLMRVVFTAGVFLYHFFCWTGMAYFRTGYLGVEFFFIMGGYFLTNGILEKHQNDGPEEMARGALGDMLRRFASVFPFFLVAVFTSFSLRHGIPRLPAASWLHDLPYLLPELFMLQLFSFPGYMTTSVSWYLCALMAGTWLVSLAVRSQKRYAFLYVFFPLLALFVYGWFAYGYQCADVILLEGTTLGLVYGMPGLLRGLAGMGLGGFVCVLSRELAKKNLDRSMRLRLSAVEWGGYALALCYIIFAPRSAMDFAVTAVIAVSVCLTMSGQTYDWKSCAPVSFLAKNCISVFLNHFTWSFLIFENYDAMKNPLFYPDSVQGKLLMYVLLTLITAVFNQILGRLIDRWVFHGGRRGRKREELPPLKQA